MESRAGRKEPKTTWRQYLSVVSPKTTSSANHSDNSISFLAWCAPGAFAGHWMSCAEGTETAPLLTSPSKTPGRHGLFRRQPREKPPKGKSLQPFPRLVPRSWSWLLKRVSCSDCMFIPAIQLNCPSSSSLNYLQVMQQASLVLTSSELS